MKTYFLAIILLIFSSCLTRQEKNKSLIAKIENYKTKNHKYPESLSQIGEKKSGYCYSSDGNNFNLEYVSYSNLYSYSSGNGVWDFLEGDASKITCKQN